MSEFQYYEFQAIDKPLTAEQKVYIRTLSRRVNPTSTHAVFTYSYSDLPQNALELLEKYFDALLYMANWGSRQMAFRFPRKAIDVEALNPYYFATDEIALKESPQHVVLSFEIHDDEPSDYIEPEGVLGTLAPLRQDILRGDYRALYLAWLKAASSDLEYEDDDPYDPDHYPDGAEDEDAYLEDEEDIEFEEEDFAELDFAAEKQGEPAGEQAAGIEADIGEADLLEPPVPPGLRQLTGTLEAFVEFLNLDEDLLEVAASASPDLEAVQEPLAEWVRQLSEEERNAFLVRIAQGDPQAGHELLRRLRQVGGAGDTSSHSLMPRRTVDSILETVEQIKTERAERARQEAEIARQKRLADLEQREPEIWAQVTALIEQKNAKAYEEALILMQQLKDLALDRERTDAFNARIAALRTRYKNRPALLDRLKRANL